MSDILMLSHPKSGRNWLRYMLSLADVSVTWSHAGGSSHNRTERYFNTPRSNRLIQGKKVIFLYRNPIDTAVSFYFEVHKKKRRKILRPVKRFLLGQLPSRDIQKFVRSRQYGVPRICKFNKYWNDFLENNDMSISVTYEDLSSDPERTLSSLLGFLGVGNADLERIVQQSSFESMKRMESIEFEDGTQVNPGERIEGDRESRFIRKGKIQGYYEYLNEETIAYCRNICEEYGFFDQ